MRHFREPRFKPLYDALPARVRASADKSFALLKEDPRHPSLHFKRIKDDLWSARIGLGYRALAIERNDGFHWFWIGSHADGGLTGASRIRGLVVWHAVCHLRQRHPGAARA